MISMDDAKKRFALVKHTMAIEGLDIPQNIEDLILKEAAGEITFKEFGEQLSIIANEA